MLDKTIFRPELGTFSLLPREIRDRIYAISLNFNIEGGGCCCRHPEIPNRNKRQTSLFRTSKSIYAEARPVFFQVNEFVLVVTRDSNDPKNRSIMGEFGFMLRLGHSDAYSKGGSQVLFENTPWDMLPHLQLVHLLVGADDGLSEPDIVPDYYDRKSGPDRPTYVTLLPVMEKAAEVLKSCHKIHLLRISIRSVDDEPGSIEKVMEPIRKLRGIRRTVCAVLSMQDDSWVDWKLRASYGRYLNNMMALPEGACAPRYVGDEQDPGGSDDDIFEIIGARWQGGTTYAQEEDSDQDDFPPAAGMDDLGLGDYIPYDILRNMGLPTPPLGIADLYDDMYYDTYDVWDDRLDVD